MDKKSVQMKKVDQKPVPNKKKIALMETVINKKMKKHPKKKVALIEKQLVMEI